MTEELGPGAPTPPIAIAGGPDGARAHLAAERVELADDFLSRLSGACAAVSTVAAERAEAARDWWPLAMLWARQGEVPAIPAAVARPTSTAEVADVLALCSAERIPVTPSAGRKPVSVPLNTGSAAP